MPGRSALRAQAEDAVARHGSRHVGLVVGMIAGGERAIASAGRTRLPDGPPPGPRTVFEIGSVTKVFTALLLAEAVVRGELMTTTPVRELLPGVTMPAGGGAAITLEHLVTHTSGLPCWPPAVGREVSGPGEPYGAVDGPALLAALARTRLAGAPGAAAVRYSNFGVGVLGHALVAAAGHDDYRSLVRDRICTPLGLPDTASRPDPAREADGHDTDGRPVGHWAVAAMPASGALRSTATDLLTFLAAQLHPGATPLGPAIALTHCERRPGIGLGWWRSGPAEDVLLAHDGGTGGFRSFAGFHPASGTGVVVLVNDAGDVAEVALDVLRRLAG